MINLVEKTPEILEWTDSSGNTVIHLAVIDGREEDVKFLVGKKLEPDRRNDSGRTALHLALQEKHSKIAEFLIEAGWDVNAEDKSLCTPLHFAVFFDNSENTIEILLKKGAKVNAQIIGMTPLHMAVSKPEAIWLVKKLLDSKDINVNIKDNKDFTPLIMAIVCRNEPAFQLLLERKEIDLSGIGNCTPLSVAIVRGYLDFAKKIYKKGGDSCFKNTDGFFLLQAAVNHFRFNIVQWLLLEETLVYLKNLKKTIPLSRALRDSDSDMRKILDMGKIMMLLLENGVDFKPISRNRESPFEVPKIEDILDLLANRPLEK